MTICNGKSKKHHSIEYSSCHEAGHALARAANGDELVCVDALQRIVTFKSKDWNCPCGGFLKMLDEGFRFNFNPDCKSCDLKVTNLLSANYAGAAATAILMPEEHDPQDAESDYAAAAEFVAPYRDALEKWRELTLTAQHEADEMVKQSATTILNLRNAIVRAGGRLDGTCAHQIIDSLSEPSGSPKRQTSRRKRVTVLLMATLCLSVLLLAAINRLTKAEL